MSQRPDEHGQLTSLLQALRVPEPSAEFLAGARRRYLDAIEMRDRRQVLTGLLAALVGVPLAMWASAALASTAAVLSLVLVARARSLGFVK